MNEKSITVVVLFGVLGIGVLALVGMTSEKTGSLVAYGEIPKCMCIVTQYDFYGNAYVTQIREIRARTMQGHNDASCNFRCEMMFGGGSRTGVEGRAIASS